MSMISSLLLYIVGGVDKYRQLFKGHELLLLYGCMCVSLG
jgi:hypothetical protein